MTDSKLKEIMDLKVKWNNQKYLIDDKGKLIYVFYSKVTPDDEKIVGWIKK